MEPILEAWGIRENMDDERRKKIGICQKMHEKARYLRGRFLNSVAVIERDIALILTEYFCTEDEGKKELFFVNVLGTLSLNSKKEILIEMVKKDYPRYWEAHGQFLLDLQKIQEFRNKLAHSVVDVSEAALSRPLVEGIGFVQWKQGQPITDQEFEEWEMRTNAVHSTLSDIKRLLPFKERPIAQLSLKSETAQTASPR